MKLGKIVTVSVVIIGITISSLYFAYEGSLLNNFEGNQNNEVELIEWNSEGLFKVLVDPNDLTVIDGITIPLKATFGLKKELIQTYNKISVLDEDKKVVFIIPTFTASAYSENGFYDFYNQKCNAKCLTTKISSIDKLDYKSSANSVKILQLLGYDSISDLELHNNPNILKNYDKVIVLHNEYVSQTMFDAITSHDNVIFLYPNSLYAKVKVDITTNKITLIRGHGYPNSEIQNGFDWENENTRPYEFDTECNDWEFYPISNGYMLNCYPEQIIWKDELFLKAIKEL